MPLQTSGTISLSQIQTQYGGANNLSISEYYNGGPNSTPNVSTSRISKIRMKGVSGTTDGNADIREFEFDGLGDWGTGDRRTGNNEITISTNMITISDPNSNTQPSLNAWINGSKELDTPDSRYLVGQVTINSNYYIEFEFVGSATKPLVNDFNKLKIYWDKSDISLDADMGTWEIMVYNQDGMELSYGNITLSESNIVSTGSGSSTDTSSITNLGSDVVLWHDAQNIDGTNNSSLTNGNTVTSWNNLSSSSFTTSNGSSYAPIYNGTGLYFNGANVYNSTVNLNNYSTMNIFVVWKPNALHSNLRWLWGQDNGGYDRTLIMYAGSGTTHYVGRGDGGAQNASYTFTANTTVIVNCEYNTSGQTGGFYINNSLNTSFSSLSPNGTNNTVFGAMNASASQYSGASGITGDMYEIIIIDRLLTSTERLNIYNYLDQKWISGGSGGGGSNEPVITPSVSINDLGDNYKYIVFQNTGNSQTSYNITFNESTICDILVVGGGGSGGVRDAGAGGAGGLIYLTNVNILNSNLSVGKGAASRSSGSHISGYKGNNTFIVINSITYTAEGGGKGGQWNGSNNNSTGSGGSGGGGGGNNSAGGTGNQPSSTSGGYGNNGAQGSGSYSGGGGGGAGGAGTRHSGDTGGNGGIGMNFSAIFGTDYGENGWFAGGGGMGSGSGANGTGGQGGGGNGANSGAAEGGMDGTGGGGGGHRNSGGTSGKGGDGIIIIRYLNNTTSHYLEFNLGTPSAIASGGYVSGVSYIPTYSQPYTTISFSDFYYQAPVTSGPPNPPNQTTHPGASGGLGNSGYEIITGMYANNTSRTEGTTSFDNRGAGGRGSSNNVKYQSLIIQAKPGDVLNLIGRINTSGTYNEYCEFWVWLGSSWSRFASPNASFYGNRDFSVNYTIPSNTVAGNYALAVACSYSSVGATTYRSWKSYSLEVWT